MNAATWFGAGVFWLFAAGPGTVSDDMQSLIGPKNFPYYSGAIAQLLETRYFHLHLTCGFVALLHLCAEWLYFGKSPRRAWLALLVGLVLIGLCEANWVQPKLKRLHVAAHAVNRPAPERERSVRSLHAWQRVTKVLSLFMLTGLGFYVWRVANPPDPMRFVSATKFRS